MKLPAVWRWRARENGDTVLELRMTQDTPFTYGLGNGLPGCRYTMARSVWSVVRSV